MSLGFDFQRRKHGSRDEMAKSSVQLEVIFEFYFHVQALILRE
jgi:hypothetical protein